MEIITKEFIHVGIQCPVCTEKSFINFEKDWGEDPAFIECLDIRPWHILCDACEEFIIESSPQHRKKTAAADFMLGFVYTEDFNMERRIKEVKFNPFCLLRVNEIKERNKHLLGA